MNILDEIKNKKRPFSVPDGYFSSVEDSVKDRIRTPQKRGDSPIWASIKTGFALAFSFVFIFGMGYGVLSLTDTIHNDQFDMENDEFAILIKDGYIKHDFIDYLYDEIDIDKDYLTEGVELYEELYQRIEDEMSQEDLLNIIEEYNNE
ncbi:MAG: hypothetical protein II318_03225 [Bacteroidales bacterium]|nr:hypothetical protein [Bacteroidales bacterium]